MSALTIQSKKFLGVLENLDIDIEDFPDKTFDCLFENAGNDLKYFLIWFYENINSTNVLSEEERAAFKELEALGQLLPEEQLQHTLSVCDPTYEDINSLPETDIQHSLVENLNSVTEDFNKLSAVYTQLELEYDTLKKRQALVKEEYHRWKKIEIERQEECFNVNAEVKNVLQEISSIIQAKPCVDVDYDAYLEAERTEHYSDLCCKQQEQFNKQSSLIDIQLKFEKLERDLCSILCSSIITQGLLKAKGCMSNELENLIYINPEKRQSVNKLSSISCIPLENDDQAVKGLQNEIQNIETSELPVQIDQLCSLKLSHTYSQYYLHSLDSLNALTGRIYQDVELNEIDVNINEVLAHKCRASVDSINRLTSFMDDFRTKLSADNSQTVDMVDTLYHFKRKHEGVLSHLEQKHPFLVPLKEIFSMEDATDVGKLKHLETASNVTMQLLKAPTFQPQTFYSHLKHTVTGLAAKLLCGPTSQLELIPIDVVLKFQQAESLMMSMSQESRKLTNKFVSFKESVSYGQRQKLLLWTLFLDNPQELELMIKKSQQESLSYERKFASGI